MIIISIYYLLTGIIIMDKPHAYPCTQRRIGRWFGKRGLYRQGSMISVHKVEPSYVTIRKHRGAPAPAAPMVPTPMAQLF